MIVTVLVSTLYWLYPYMMMINPFKQPMLTGTQPPGILKD